MSEQRKYLVKMSWIFNIESMSDHLHCKIYDVEDGKLQLPIVVAETECNSIEDIEALIEEAYELEWKAKCGRVTGKEYGRIREFVNYRVYARYETCIANGMDESRAGMCFSDI